MMGGRVMAEPVFSTVRINDCLPAGHLLRAVDALLDTAFVRGIMAPHYRAWFKVGLQVKPGWRWQDG